MVNVSADTLTVSLSDGRTITTPLDWYPRLKTGTRLERQRWELIGAGQGVHWPDLDEDIGVEALLRGHRSNEARTSFEAWLARRPP